IFFVYIVSRFDAHANLLAFRFKRDLDVLVPVMFSLLRVHQLAHLLFEFDFLLGQLHALFFYVVVGERGFVQCPDCPIVHPRKGTLPRTLGNGLGINLLLFLLLRHFVSLPNFLFRWLCHRFAIFVRDPGNRDNFLNHDVLLIFSLIKPVAQHRDFLNPVFQQLFVDRLMEAVEKKIAVIYVHSFVHEVFSACARRSPSSLLDLAHNLVGRCWSPFDCLGFFLLRFSRLTRFFFGAGMVLAGWQVTVNGTTVRTLHILLLRWLALTAAASRLRWCFFLLDVLFCHEILIKHAGGAGNG